LGKSSGVMAAPRMLRAARRARTALACDVTEGGKFVSESGQSSSAPSPSYEAIF
jgi:hypothetical protein